PPSTTAARPDRDDPAGMGAVRPRPLPVPDGASAAPPAVFTFPNRVLFGTGASGWLSGELDRMEVHRPLIVTDVGLIATGIVARLIAPLGDRAVVHADVHANPTEADVLSGLQRYRDAGCDGLVGLGGGSPIDAAKAIRLLVAHPGRLAEYDLTRG